MKHVNEKFNIVLLLAFLLFSTQIVYAGYDVVSAKTVNKDNDAAEVVEDSIPTANDPELPNFSEDTSVAGFIKNKTRRLFRKKSNTHLEELPSDIQEDQLKQNRENTVVSEKNNFQINADKITYDDIEGNVYAKGNVEIIANAQGVKLSADNAVLDKKTQTIKLTDNVKINQGGLEMSGDSLIIDLNEENIIMDNPTADAYSFRIKAQESYLIANDLQMINGTIQSTSNKEFPVIPPRFYSYAPGGGEIIYDPEVRSDTDVDRKKKVYRIDAKEIVITNYKDHNSLVLKGSNVYYNNHKVIPNSDIEIISDKDNQNVETNMPEIGTLRSFGTYVGYGFLRRLPKGQSIKVMPALTYGEGRLGVGLIGRHRSKNSMLQAGMSSSTERFVARGKYRFGNGFALLYGRNAYLNEGFMGSRRSGYAAQLGFEKAYNEKDQKITFRHGTYAGIFSDYHKEGRKHYFSTTRFRHNLQISKEIFEYKNAEQDVSFRLNAIAQASATVYGTGDTTGMVRIGPMLSTKVKKWESNIAYYQGGIHGDSPFVFDKYRYGRTSIYMNEKFNFNNVFALGYTINISPNKDNYEKDLITESRFYAVIGPRDLKIALSYDFVRDIGHLDFMFILGSDNTKINFEKLTTENLDGSKQKQDFYKKAKTVKVEDI